MDRSSKQQYRTEYILITSLWLSLFHFFPLLRSVFSGYYVKEVAMFNPLVANGLSNVYHLDESTFIFRDIGSNFSFLFHFSKQTE